MLDKEKIFRTKGSDYLQIFRRCSSLTSLERLINKLDYELLGLERKRMLKAAAHRKAELMSGKLFDEDNISPSLLNYIS